MTYVVKTELSPSDPPRPPQSHPTHRQRPPPSAISAPRPSRSKPQLAGASLRQPHRILALILACIGIYGIRAYNVARRTSEIEVRMAPGARTRQVLWMILRDSSWLAVLGIVAGLAAAFGLTRFVRTMLYGLQPPTPPPSSSLPRPYSSSPGVYTRISSRIPAGRLAAPATAKGRKSFAEHT